MNKLKQKIKNNEKITGTHIWLADPAIGRIVGLAGYDYAWIDYEHSYLSIQDVLVHINALKTTETAAVVRVPQDDFTATKKVVELGVDGIIFPMIRSAEQARKLIEFTLYPPEGNRGFGPLGANDYGYMDGDEYLKNSIDSMCRFIQIEHIDAANCLDELMEIPYIDGFIFGPNDLSGSINDLGNVFGDENLKIIKEVIAKLKANGKYVGLSTGSSDPEVLKRWSDMGIDMLSGTADFCLLVEGFKKTANDLKKLHKGEN